MSKAGTSTLHISRIRSMAIETFKIAYGQSPQYPQNFITFKDSSYNFRYTKLLDLPRTKTTRYGTNSFNYQAALLWNALPEEARKITSFNTFKHFIKFWNGTVCKCALCK